MRVQYYQVMQKSGQCQCGKLIKILNSQCLYQCGRCSSKGVFLCHMIPDQADPVFIRCRECHQAYTLFQCPQCSGTGAIKQFASGHVYGCVCGFNANFVSCNICTSLLCFPPKLNCEDSVLECKKCSNRFKYRVCGVCGECNYMSPDQTANAKECYNEKCKLYSEKVGKNINPAPIPDSNPYSLPQNMGGNYPSINSNMVGNSDPYPSVMPSSTKDTKCKVCRQVDATMLNTTCFHLSVCENCQRQLSLDECPICKKQGVFKQVQF